MKKLLFSSTLVLLLGVIGVATTHSIAQAGDTVVDGKALYLAKCAGCHGPDGSKGLKGLSYGYTVNALTGYKAKTYGGAKKDIMQARAAALTSQDIDALAVHVSGF